MKVVYLQMVLLLAWILFFIGIIAGDIEGDSMILLFIALLIYEFRIQLKKIIEVLTSK